LDQAPRWVENCTVCTKLLEEKFRNKSFTQDNQLIRWSWELEHQWELVLQVFIYNVYDNDIL
jgi:hypothetical protein